MMLSAQQGIEGYFYGALAALSVPVGAVGLRLIHALTGGAWGRPLIRLIVSASRTIYGSIILWIPVLIWLPHFYGWAAPQGTPIDPALSHVWRYMTPHAFIIRSVAYFAVWSAIVWWLDHYNEARNLSGLLAVVYFLAGSFAAMDWVMSLMPRWSSTIFGAVFVTGQVLTAYCGVLIANGFSRQPGGAPASAVIDEGNLLLTFVLFWAYLAFSQYLIIWMGNVPHEVSWYHAASAQGWRFMAPAIIVGHLFLPLFLLLRQSWKAYSGFLAAIAGIIVIMRMGDLAWMVFGGLARSPGSLTIAHGAAALAVIGVFLAVWIRLTGWKEAST